MVLHAHTLERGATQLALQGQLTVDNAATLHHRLVEVVQQSEAVTLDLSLVEKIDLACLQLLFATQKSSRNSNKAFSLAGVDNPVVSHALQMNGLDLAMS